MAGCAVVEDELRKGVVAGHEGPTHAQQALAVVGQVKAEDEEFFMSKNTPNLPEDYARLLADVKERVRAAQYAALKAVNKELVGLYWDIGRMIAARQADSAHGDAIVEQLSRDLRAEFPGISGFSRRNVYYYSTVVCAACHLMIDRVAVEERAVYPTKALALDAKFTSSIHAIHTPR